MTILTEQFSTQQLKDSGADFGAYPLAAATYASIGSEQFVRCYNAGEDVWEKSTPENPIRDWLFYCEGSIFHARSLTSLAEALRIVDGWNRDCPHRAIVKVSDGEISRSIAAEVALS